MSCNGLEALNPVCQVGQAITVGAAGVADSAFSHIAGFFGTAALSTTTWLWDQIDSATSLDLTSPQLGKELAATAAIAAVLCMGLFLIQVITATLRSEPGGLGRAVRGLLISFLGSAFALASAKLLIAAIDALSASVVSYTMGTNIHGVGDKLAFGQLVAVQNPALALIFAIVILCASVVVWAAMMTRKMMVLIAAVLAPLAFSGATADITRSWVRRWIEFVAAMIVSKLLLVIILSVGVSVLDGAGQAGSGPTQVFTQLSAGSLILLMGGLAPWVAIRMFHFAGDTLYAAHATAAQGSAGAHSVVAAPHKVSSVQWQARSLTSSMRGHPAWGGAAGSGQSGIAGGPVRATTGASVTSVAPATSAGAGGGTAAVGAGVAGTTLAGTAAAGTAAAGPAVAGTTAAGAAVAGPAVAAVAVPAAVGIGTVKGANAAHTATIGAAAGSAPETPSEPTPPVRAPNPSPPPVPKPGTHGGHKTPGIDP
jgi:type IV secretion system protein TrbL